MNVALDSPKLHRHIAVRARCITTRATQTVTINNIIDEWLKYEESQIKITSLSTYRAYARKQIRPVLGDIPADKLTEEQVLNFITMICSAEKGLAKKSVHLITNVLKQVLTFGKKYGIVVEPNICNIRTKINGQRTANTLTEEEQVKLIYALRNCNRLLDLGVYLSLKTGLRVGEVAGLQWGDIDFEAGFLNVRRTIARIYDDDGKSVVYVGEPKSESSKRKVPLTPALLKLLEEHRQDDEIYVTSCSVKPHEVASLQNHFKVVLKRAGIRDINFHSLRHTFATRCVEKGFDVKSLSMILGHSDVSITLNTYVHPSMESLRTMMESLE